jgi:hypothetical protein
MPKIPAGKARCAAGWYCLRGQFFKLGRQKAVTSALTDLSPSYSCRFHSAKLSTCFRQRSISCAICQTPREIAVHALRTALSSRPIAFKTGNNAPRLGNNCPLNNAQNTCNNAGFVPISNPTSSSFKTAMVWFISVMVFRDLFVKQDYHALRHYRFFIQSS